MQVRFELERRLTSIRKTYGNEVLNRDSVFRKGTVPLDSDQILANIARNELASLRVNQGKIEYVAPIRLNDSYASKLSQLGRSDWEIRVSEELAQVQKVFPRIEVSESFFAHPDLIHLYHLKDELSLVKIAISTSGETDVTLVRVLSSGSSLTPEYFTVNMSSVDELKGVLVNSGLSQISLSGETTKVLHLPSSARFQSGTLEFKESMNVLSRATQSISGGRVKVLDHIQIKSIRVDPFGRVRIDFESGGQVRDLTSGDVAPLQLNRAVGFDSVDELRSNVQGRSEFWKKVLSLLQP